MAAAVDQLSVLLACHQHLLAIPVRRLERLALPEELAPVAAPAASLPVLRWGTIRYAAWDLGPLLGLPELGQAWVLLRVRHAGTELHLALGVGRCRLVAPVAGIEPLPPGMFKARRAALWGTFPAAGVRGALGESLMGLCLDPLSLWSPEELERSAQALIAAHAA